MKASRLLAYGVSIFFVATMLSDVVVAQTRETIVLGTLRNDSNVSYKFIHAITQYTTPATPVPFKIIENGTIDLISFFGLCLFVGGYSITVVSPSKEKIETNALEFAYTFTEGGNIR
jgi:hypothetical protein